MNSPDVQAMIGLRVENGKLLTELPGSEILKPLRRMVLDIAAKKDLAGKKVDSRSFNNKSEMINYVRSFGEADKPDLSKKVAERPVEGIEKDDFTKPARITSPRRSSGPAERKQVVPRNCSLNVTDNRIAEIYRELRTLKLEEARNAIAVLMRVFLELSVDHFLEKHGGSLSVPNPGGGERYKELDKKLAETVELLVSMGVPRPHFAAVSRSLSVSTSPLRIDLMHAYVHSRFATPFPAELTAAWDHAQPLFEKIWP